MGRLTLLLAIGLVSLNVSYSNDARLDPADIGLAPKSWRGLTYSSGSVTENKNGNNWFDAAYVDANKKSAASIRVSWQNTPNSKETLVNAKVSGILSNKEINLPHPSKVISANVLDRNLNDNIPIATLATLGQDLVHRLEFAKHIDSRSPAVQAGFPVLRHKGWIFSSIHQHKRSKNGVSGGTLQYSVFQYSLPESAPTIKLNWIDRGAARRGASEDKEFKPDWTNTPESPQLIRFISRSTFVNVEAFAKDHRGHPLSAQATVALKEICLDLVSKFEKSKVPMLRTVPLPPTGIKPPTGGIMTFSQSARNAATIAQVTGSVAIMRPDSSGRFDRISLDQNDRLKIGDRVVLAQGGSIAVRFDDPNGGPDSTGFYVMENEGWFEIREVLKTKSPAVAVGKGMGRIGSSKKNRQSPGIQLVVSNAILGVIEGDMTVKSGVRTLFLAGNQGTKILGPKGVQEVTAGTSFQLNSIGNLEVTEWDHPKNAVTQGGDNATKNWKTITNKEEGFQYKIPQNWIEYPPKGDFVSWFSAPSGNPLVMISMREARTKTSSGAADAMIKQAAEFSKTEVIARDVINLNNREADTSIITTSPAGNSVHIVAVVIVFDGLEYTLNCTSESDSFEENKKMLQAIGRSFIVSKIAEH